MSSSSTNLPYLKLLDTYKQLLVSTTNLTKELIEFKEQTNTDISHLDSQIEILINKLNE